MLMADTLQKRGNFVQYQLFTQGKAYSKKYPNRFYDYCTLSHSVSYSSFAQASVTQKLHRE